MRRDYCSLADHRYLPQLLALYESLKKHSSEEFKLHILAMDKECSLALMDLVDESEVFIGDLGIFESQRPEMVQCRQNRTWQEFCWTAASNFADVIMQNKGPESITYLDADLMFFSDPKVIFDRIGDRSIGITPHYFPDQYKYLERNGRYCVSIAHFKGNEVGRKCLSRWAQQCREWCRYENAGPGLFADQGYLDLFPTLYGKEVAELPRDVAWAPWNLSEYDGRPITAFHFHEFRQREDGTFQLTNYPVSTKAFMDIYSPYIYAVTAAKERIEAVHLQA